MVTNATKGKLKDYCHDLVTVLGRDFLKTRNILIGDRKYYIAIDVCRKLDIATPAAFVIKHVSTNNRMKKVISEVTKKGGVYLITINGILDILEHKKTLKCDILYKRLEKFVSDAEEKTNNNKKLQQEECSLVNFF